MTTVVAFVDDKLAAVVPEWPIGEPPMVGAILGLLDDVGTGSTASCELLVILDRHLSEHCHG